MTILDLIKKEILNIALELQYISKAEIEDFKFDVSFIDESNSRFGDVSVNISLILARKLSKTPKEIGEEILKSIDSNIESGKELSKIIKNADLAANLAAGIHCPHRYALARALTMRVCVV